MSVDDPNPPVEPELDARLRETLSRVAMTVGETPPGPGTSPAPTPPSARRPPRHRWRPTLAVIAVALAALLLAGFAYLHFAPEHVTEQKLVQVREDALAAGGAEPNRWWLVPAFHTDACSSPCPGSSWSPSRPTVSARNGTQAPSPTASPSPHGKHNWGYRRPIVRLYALRRARMAE